MPTETNEGQLASQTALAKIVDRFPQVKFAFGYGSGVFSQTLDEKHEGMLDMIFVVDDAELFHQENINRHPDHYAPWLRYSGSKMANRIQRNFILKDAHVLFHVVDSPVPMKYGVVHQDDLLRDLTLWESLYLAGRLHKPTLPITLNPPDELVEAQNRNLQSAVATALLLLPSKEDHTFSWPTFYSQIAGLSYSGDFRMKVGGEDPRKISKLVDAQGQLGRFHDLYQPILQPFEQRGIISLSSSRVEWNRNDLSARKALLQSLPRNIAGKDESIQNLETVLASIVAPAARHQSFKGIFTLGLRKSIKYAGAKLQKGLFRKK